MLRTNEIRYIKLCETCKCKCILDASVCNNKQRQNNDKCRCEYNELIGKGLCDKGVTWNPSNCEFYFDWYLKKINSGVTNINPRTETIIVKQNFIEINCVKHINGKDKKINIKNLTCYFFEDIINIKTFDQKLLKMDKRSYKNIDIYYIG